MLNGLFKGLVKVLSSVSSRSLPGVLNLASLWFFSHYLDSGEYAENSNYVYLVSYISGMTLGIVYFSLVVILPSSDEDDKSLETLAYIFKKAFLFLSVLFIFIWLMGLLEPRVILGILVLSLFQYSVELNRAKGSFKVALRLLYTQSFILFILILFSWYFSAKVSFESLFILAYSLSVLAVDFSTVSALFRARLIGEKKVVFDMFSVFSGAFLLKVSEGFVPAFLRYVVLPHYPDSKDFATLAMDLVQRFVATLFNAVKFFVMPSQVKEYHGRKFNPKVGGALNHISLIIAMTVITSFVLVVTYSDLLSNWEIFHDLGPKLAELDLMYLFFVIVIYQISNFYRKSSVDIYLMSNRRYSELVLLHFFALVTASTFFYFGFAYLGVFCVVAVYYVTIYFLSRILLREKKVEL
ncbi:hypothetical protein OPW33_01425 [Vibrio europaeus]|uniref:hypothetical protein n=1 Tax=Vibrio europaeus TaxID=300876 RepID=UPI002341448B|nr:hypothetical protein [Vibrio europaeus]MDC5837988.1 hypothetical protein [Vibrio europaeus]